MYKPLEKRSFLVINVEALIPKNLYEKREDSDKEEEWLDQFEDFPVRNWRRIASKKNL
jgi:hypothetical protein